MFFKTMSTINKVTYKRKRDKEKSVNFGGTSLSVMCNMYN